MKALILMFGLVGCGQLNNFNTGAMLATNATLAVDWHQTHWMTKHQDRYAEANPMLGARPSSGAVSLYFSSWLVASTAAHYVLPKWSQPIVYTIITSLEISTIRDNLNTGTGW